MRYVIGIIFLLLSFDVFATHSNSFSCGPISLKSQNKNIILKRTDEKIARVYILKNVASHSIWLDHPTEGRSLHAGWSSYLRPGNSSALLVNHKNFNISCAVIKPGKVDYLDCEKEIAVCTPKEVVLTGTRKGTYWLAEDKLFD